jgi:hypothetical protein
MDVNSISTIPQTEKLGIGRLNITFTTFSEQCACSSDALFIGECSISVGSFRSFPCLFPILDCNYDACVVEN